MSSTRPANTAQRILDTAEKLVQERGFNAFSYADIAKTLGIRKASLHYHYATKAMLGRALIERYRGNFREALGAIDASGATAPERLARYAELYAAVLRRRRMCLCGMLATDSATLPASMRSEVAEFFAENETWLAAVLEEGRRLGTLKFEGAAGPLASLLVSALEGAMLVARGAGGSRYFAQVAGRLLDGLRPVPAGAARRRRR